MQGLFALATILAIYESNDKLESINTPKLETVLKLGITILHM